MMKNKCAWVVGIFLGLQSASSGAEGVCYQGKMQVAGETRQVTFRMDSTVQDHFQGDPDMEDHGFNFRVIEAFAEEKSQACNLTLEIQQYSYIETCAKRYLVVSPSSPSDLDFFFGEIFTTLARFSPRIAPIGSFSFHSVSCPKG